MQSIIEGIDKKLLQEDINNLSECDKLIERGDFVVFLSESNKLPNILKEIGRLRELTFRSVGEGTGKAYDLDEYDQYFSNLFIWDKKNQAIAGGYRVGLGNEIFEKHGVKGFYINSLFDIEKSAFPLLYESVELGRSYIVENYQRAYLPFFLLWQGILVFWLKNPQYKHLIGPVSISKYYSDISKSLMVAFAKKFFLCNKYAASFKPKTPFAVDLEEIDLEDIDGSTMRDLEKFLLKIEPTHLRVPTMIKQYAKLNARFLSFNIDPNFSDALDGLMLLNLNDVPENIIQLLQEK